MGEFVQNRIAALLSLLSGTKKPILPSTSINHDLRLYGDDAYELLETIHSEFGTNFTSMAFQRYFYNEGDVMPFSWVWRFFPLEKKENLTVQHLLDAVEKGVWFD